MSEPITRNAIVVILGTPDKTDGSLNSPVEREEAGIRFNEKWTYTHLHDDPSEMPMRVIYWHRYDFTGTLVRSGTDAEWKADSSLAECAIRINDRLSLPEKDHHTPLPGNRDYRPVSRVRNDRDLGGYIEGSKDHPPEPEPIK
jgi:hypothetical protein